METMEAHVNALEGAYKQVADRLNSIDSRLNSMCPSAAMSQAPLKFHFFLRLDDLTPFRPRTLERQRVAHSRLSLRSFASTALMRA